MDEAGSRVARPVMDSKEVTGLDPVTLNLGTSVWTSAESESGVGVATVLACWRVGSSVHMQSGQWH